MTVSWSAQEGLLNPMASRAVGRHVLNVEVMGVRSNSRLTRTTVAADQGSSARRRFPNARTNRLCNYVHYSAGMPFRQAGRPDSLQLLPGDQRLTTGGQIDLAR